MPFLKLIDSVLVFLLRDVARYRFHVIRRNLRSSFDYYSERDLSADQNKFYRFLAQIIRQVVFLPSTRLLEKKYHLDSQTFVDQWLREGKSIIVTMGHVGNWEWAGLFLGHIYPGQVCALYKQIKSKPVNKMMMRRRMSTGVQLVEAGRIHTLLRTIQSKPMLILMLADQNPGNDKRIIWAPFLKKETAFVNGPGTLSSKYGLPVVYLRTIPKGDGGYLLNFEIISTGDPALNAEEITSRYAALLENNIETCRAEWLWSHKRWKRDKNELQKKH